MTKHLIDVKYHMFLGWIAKKIFELFYIMGNKNLADIFIKALAAPPEQPDDVRTACPFYGRIA
eukprot:CAMPEP_0198206688 /NCGR_PEP_ID=MMETSP1445-20131203/10227_1 /TAXON_ID=36898 /ORGANISM="Pyramimonas sp., Strain CCMP2087" /LENGTH=62 /DNA_ID=CAMNT_0043879467 /DNA_START=627 /DNA_END=816 /DNA_ORIENTATION=+